MGDELQQALRAGNSDEDVGAFVVTGAGRGFCAGADIKDLFAVQADSGEVRQGSEESSNWIDVVKGVQACRSGGEWGGDWCWVNTDSSDGLYYCC